ncbi:hypothetical protein VitviT2T_017636 [Vitis vinifera]|uniref:Glutaredoxin domain-containing protein n=2 Tax=Vitis vinifera TaxID=29760 RepID=A0ABY9CV36_VITVI|nr:glutaredoxin-C9 [Vitis vinifera]WJZ99169.1 hypothetical protein VitviT2T_017636 [Vitis vinifera]|eukprot:XP_002262673.1 PREDICTED: glutaredoxin-C9 [Vitis vinifera]
MQEALPYKTWLPIPREPRINTPTTPLHNQLLLPGTTNITNMVSENAVIVFGRRGCCMTHVVKRLLLGLGVNPAVCEVNEEDEIGVLDELGMVGAGEGKQGAVQFPAVFIGGRLFGGLDRVMAAHITGELVPILKQAGALWL